MKGKRFGTVAIGGRVNVEKSSLLNAIFGRKMSIESPKPNTTRFEEVVVYRDERGAILFYDLPGLGDVRDKFDRAVVDRGRGYLSVADLVYYVTDNAPLERDLENLEVLREEGKRAFLVFNKVDLFKPKKKLLPLWEEWSRVYDWAEIVGVSALTRENVDLLLELTFKYLPEGEADFSKERLLPVKWTLSEIIREKLLLHLEDELPFATAVVVDSVEKRGRKVRVSATIYVEKESQKPIVLGKGGSMIKKVGTEAREEMERFLKREVYLDLWVKVKRWREDSWILKEIMEMRGESG